MLSCGTATTTQLRAQALELGSVALGAGGGGVQHAGAVSVEHQYVQHSITRITMLSVDYGHCSFSRSQQAGRSSPPQPRPLCWLGHAGLPWGLGPSIMFTRRHMTPSCMPASCTPHLSQCTPATSPAQVHDAISHQAPACLSLQHDTMHHVEYHNLLLLLLLAF